MMRRLTWVLVLAAGVAVVVLGAALPAGGGQQEAPGGGAADATADAGKQELLEGFEPGGKNTFDALDKGQFVKEHATQGEHSWKVTAEKGKTAALGFGFFRGSNAAGRWSQFDRFVVDVFVEGGAAKGYCFMRDEQAKDWGTRFNLDFQLTPGRRRIEIPIGSIVRQQGSKPLDVDKLTWVSLSFNPVDGEKPTTLYFDNARLVKGGGDSKTTVLFSFEGADRGTYVLEDWPPEFKGRSALAVVAEHATDGGKALRLDSHSEAGNVQFTVAEDQRDFSGYDVLVIDIFNPDTGNVPVGGWIKAKPGDSYDQRHNWQRMLRPGHNSVRLSLGAMEVPGGRVSLEPTCISVFNLAVPNKTVFLDNIRLVRGSEQVPVAGMRKFDFGPKGGAVMAGFEAVSRETTYPAARGAGWLPRGDFGRDFDIREVMNRHRPFDDLIRDSCNPAAASFQVDVPSGEYTVWLMMNVPGGCIWHRSYDWRKVLLNGRAIVEEKWNAESFKKWEFRWQDAEDLPGEDIWERYVNSVYRPVCADVTVTDGKIVLAFSGGQFSALVCGLAVWPKAQDAQAAKWEDALSAQRREQYYTMHVDSAPPAEPVPAEVAAAAKGKPFVRFIHSPDRPVTWNSAPTAAEMGAAGINLAAAPGEYEDGCFGLFVPADSKAADTKAAGKLTARWVGGDLPLASASVQVVRYKAVNHDAVYTVEPRYLDVLGEAGLELRPGVTRSFWLILKVADAAKAGAYSGKVELAMDGKVVDTIPVNLHVWPVKLAEPSIPMSIFITTPQYDYLRFAPGPEAREAAWKEVLVDAREHGMTSVDPAISVPLKEVKDGKAVIDFGEMDRFMDQAKAAGYTKELSGYSLSTGVPLRPQAMDDGSGDRAAQAFGLKTYGELVKAYFDAYKEHAAAKAYLPMCFGSDDEYLVHGAGPKALQAYHKVLKDNAPGVRFVAFDSIYPDEKPDLLPAYTAMLKETDTWGAGLHSPKLQELLKASGARLWLYNTGLDRFTFGTYMFFAAQRHDVKGFVQWVYPLQGTLTKYDMASHREANYGVVYPSDHGLRTTPIWERIRAGCDDHRYIQTAWELSAPAAGDAAAKAAAKAELRQTIEKTLSKLRFGGTKVDPASGEGKAENPMNPEQMEALRKALAEGIEKVQK